MDATLGIICTVIGAVLGIIGTILTVLNYKKNSEEDTKQEIKQQTIEDTNVKMQLNYISRGIDDIKLDLRALNKEIELLKERVTRTEESTKQAHKRIDNFEKEGI